MTWGKQDILTQIWIEPVKKADGSNWYSGRNGLLLRPGSAALTARSCAIGCTIPCARPAGC